MNNVNKILITVIENTDSLKSIKAAQQLVFMQVTQKMSYNN